jgi:putative hydrolase of the HAD superfamily
MIPPTVKAIFFDAVGTLIHPEPSALVVYEEVGRRLGSQLPRKVIKANFHRAFCCQDELDKANGYITDESREVQRWQAIVAESLSDLPNAERAFYYLFSYFARSSSWRWLTEAEPVLNELFSRGFELGMASNFDGRLRDVLAPFPAMKLLSNLVISSEVGWRKPAPAFFASVCRSVGLSPEQVLYVGDDLVNDYQGARDAGLQSVLFAPGKVAPIGSDCIQSLGQLLEPCTH